jgi:type I restriction enzyme R subunit
MPGEIMQLLFEAHSSQGGESSRKMTEALAGKNVSLEEAEKVEGEIEAAEVDETDYIREVIKKRGPQKNISVFAFTATPKAKTLEVFGTKDSEGKPKPFHLYSMRQAIEEVYSGCSQNYILTKNTTRILKAIEDDLS